MHDLQSSKEIDVVIFSSSKEKEDKLCALLQVGGYSFVRSESLANFNKLISEGYEFAIALVDQSVAFEPKLELLRKIKDKLPSIQSIIIGAEHRVDFAMRASNEGVFWLLLEPFENEELLYLIARGLVVQQLAKENQTLRTAMRSAFNNDTLIGQSDVMRKLLARIQKIATLDSAVLLTGESGTGKTLLASILHKCSPRAKGCFTAISCANLPKDLLESELFGSEKGAYTGANVSRPGAIELCNGGTLFLDEIGELPLELQPKLLTFLQDKMVRRLGGRTSKQVDVRIVCATNKNLEDAVAEGLFREDLFYRVNVLNIRVPALRERKADIPVLSENILLKICKRRGRLEPLKLSQQALNFLINYDWPGNVRELEHALERASAFTDAIELQVSDFESSLSLKVVSDKAKLVGLTLREVESQLIKETLRHCDNNKKQAAKMLGISLKTLYNKLNDMGCDKL